MWLGIAGFVVIVVLMSRHVNGAIMLGILFTTLISWIPNHSASYLTAESQIAGGVDRFEVKGRREGKSGRARERGSIRDEERGVEGPGG